MDWLGFLSGGAVTGIIAALLTRASAKESNKTNNNVQLWDRTYKLIESLEKQVEVLRGQLEEEEKENETLRNTIRDVEVKIEQLKQQFSQTKRG